MMMARHGALDRTALLLRAGIEPLTDTDRARIRRAGLGSAALGDVRKGGQRVPSWLEKWTALVLDFLDLEELLLKESLLQDSVSAYTPAGAAAEARGVYANRLQNVAITLDKVKMVLGVRGGRECRRGFARNGYERTLRSVSCSKWHVGVHPGQKSSERPVGSSWWGSSPLNVSVLHATVRWPPVWWLARGLGYREDGSCGENTRMGGKFGGSRGHHSPSRSAHAG